MDPLVTAALIKGGVSLGSSLFGNSQAKKQQQREFEQNYFLQLQSQAYNTKERLASQDYNTLMWEKANEYNSPLAQLQRGLDAGINPNVLFGSGVDGSTTSPVTTSPQSSGISSAPSISSALINTNLAESFNLLANAGLADAQKNKVNQETKFDKATFDARVKSVNQEYDNLVKQGDAIALDNTNKQQIIDYYAKMQDAELEKIVAETDRIRNEAIRTGVLIDTAKKENQLLDEKITTEQLSQDAIKANTDNTREDTRLKKQQRFKLVSDIQVNDATIAEKQSNIFVNDATIANIKQDTDNAKADNPRIVAVASIEKMKADLSAQFGFPIGSPKFDALFALWKQGRYGDLLRAGIVGSEINTSLSLDNLYKIIKEDGEEDTSNNNNQQSSNNDQDLLKYVVLPLLKYYLK